MPPSVTRWPGTLEPELVALQGPDRRGLEVPVLALGDPDGPPIVLLPGLTDGLHPVTRPASQQMFADLPVPMNRCRGLVLSYRQPLRSDVSTAILADDVAEVLARLVAGPVVLICHSMGTMVAQHVAARHPSLVAGMVLSAPLVRADDRVRTVIERWADHVRAGRFAAFAEDALVCSYTGEEREHRRELSRALPPDVPGEGYQQRHLRLTAACLGHDAGALLGRIRAPTLLLAGDEDPVAPPDHAEELAVHLTDARLHVLPGLAHGFPEQASVPFAALVTSFLGEVAGRDPVWGRADGHAGR